MRGTRRGSGGRKGPETGGPLPLGRAGLRDGLPESPVGLSSPAGARHPTFLALVRGRGGSVVQSFSPSVLCLLFSKAGEGPAGTGSDSLLCPRSAAFAITSTSPPSQEP